MLQENINLEGISISKSLWLPLLSRKVYVLSMFSLPGCPLIIHLDVDSLCNISCLTLQRLNHLQPGLQSSPYIIFWKKFYKTILICIFSVMRLMCKRRFWKLGIKLKQWLLNNEKGDQINGHKSKENTSQIKTKSDFTVNVSLNNMISPYRKDRFWSRIIITRWTILHYSFFEVSLYIGSFSLYTRYLYI